MDQRGEDDGCYFVKGFAGAEIVAGKLFGTAFRAANKVGGGGETPTEVREERRVEIVERLAVFPGSKTRDGL